MRRMLAFAFLIALALTTVGAPADPEPPLPEPGFGGVGGTPGTCIRPDPSNPAAYPAVHINPYGDACTRLKFAYGPIVVQPGDNDTGLSVKTIEKPWYDGYMVGIAPNLVTADGSVPDIENLHLHHATWLSQPSYGNGPFFAAGEEKTIARFPVGYGMPVKATDVWYFVHMIHNEGTRPEVVWVTYHVDYVPKAVGDQLDFGEAAAAYGLPAWTGIRTIKPFWLDVWKNGRRASYPVYNSQRGFGGPITDPVTLDIVSHNGVPLTTRECVWPKNECAAHDSWSDTDVGQGGEGNLKGTDIYATGSMSGTLIGIGGHLHPGGTRAEVDIVRCTEGDPIRPNETISTWGGLACPDGPDADTVAGEVSRRVFTSDAVYFDRDFEGNAIKPMPTSWNFSMTVAGLPRWAINLKEKDMLRINSAYETSLGSWYEGMGIAVAYVHPVPPGQMYGLDPFTAAIDSSRADGPGGCWEKKAANTLCTRGSVTHGPLPEAGNPGGLNQSDWVGIDGPLVSDIAIAGFRYLPGNYAAGSTIVPQVKVDQPVTFWNLDAYGNVFHSVTACEYPCNGSVGIAYPYPDFGWGRADLAPGGSGPIAYDSSELGYSLATGPAKGQVGLPAVGGQVVPPDQLPDWARDAISYTIVPEELGLEPNTPENPYYTYFCRVHPFMVGAFKVVP